MLCPESLRVQAYMDGEVDALGSAELERHLEHCAECQQLRGEIEALRTALRRHVPSPQMPPALRKRVMRALDRESAIEGSQQTPSAQKVWRLRPFWMGAVGGLATSAAVAALAFLFLLPSVTNPMVDEVLRAHVGSLMSSHLIDVVSTDRHTVKPWFAGHTDVSPAVADFAAQGYKLVGGRIDYLRHQRAAVVVYEHGPHIINVFCWAASPGLLPGNATHSGYHLVFWKSGDLAYAAVSDTGWAELMGLQRLLVGVEPSAPPP